jgi:hypothetical protein
MSEPIHDHTFDIILPRVSVRARKLNKRMQIKRMRRRTFEEGGR